MIVCQVCQQNPATVHLTELGKEGPQELHFCEDCARKKGVAVKTQISISELIKTFIENASGRDAPADLSQKECPACGLSYAEFKSSGRLGCPDDYALFHEALDPLLERIHGSPEHTGKVPSSAGKDARRAGDLRQLRIALNEAVHREDYEQAAELRDRIQQLQLSGGEPGDG